MTGAMQRRAQLGQRSGFLGTPLTLMAILSTCASAEEDADKLSRVVKVAVRGAFHFALYTSRLPFESVVVSEAAESHNRAWPGSFRLHHRVTSRNLKLPLGPFRATDGPTCLIARSTTPGGLVLAGALVSTSAAAAVERSSLRAWIRVAADLGSRYNAAVG